MPNLKRREAQEPDKNRYYTWVSAQGLLYFLRATFDTQAPRPPAAGMLARNRKPSNNTKNHDKVEEEAAAPPL